MAAAVLAGTHAFVSCWGNFWARKSSCACARLTRAKTRATRDCVVLQRSRHGEAAAGGSTGGDVPAPGMAYVPRHLVQKVKGVAGLLTEARVRAVRSCRGVGDEVLWWRTGGARGGRSNRGCSRLLDSLDWREVLLRRRWKGQHDRSITGGEQLLEESLTCGGSWREIQRVQGLGSATVSSEALLELM